jgi:ribosomal protein S18 acetylase RimI-like enzyme
VLLSRNGRIGLPDGAQGPAAARRIVSHELGREEGRDGRLRWVRAAIRRLLDADVETVIAFSVAAWAPVFASLERELGPVVFSAVFPDWLSSQASAVDAACRAAGNDVWVAIVDDRPAGFVAVAFHDEGATPAGEIHMIAVDPAHQRAGLGAGLLQHAVAEIKARGVDLVVIATGGDRGHGPARALYEKLDFHPLHLVRYYRELE